MRYAYNFYGWYAGPCNDSEPRSTETAPGNTSQATTPGQLRANWTGYEWLNLPYQLPPQPVIDRPALTADIDRRADALRLAIVGDPVRVEEYRLARDEAAAYIAAGYTGTVPLTVQAWATAKGWTARQSADDIAATAQAWEAALYAIRSIRLIGKEAVRNAASDQAAQTAHDTTVAQLAAIAGQ